MGGKFRISGSSTGNTYDKTPNGIVCYNRLGKRIHINIFLKEENVKYIGNGVFERNTTVKKTQKASPAAKKLNWWDKTKAVGRGAVKSVTAMFTDKNGKFSLKQTAKTIGTGVAVTAAAAVAVTLGAPAAVVTGVIVGVGCLIGAVNVADGINQVANAENAEQELKGYETIGEGTGEIGLSLIMRKGIKKSLTKARTAGMTAKRNALTNGSGKRMAALRGTAAAVRSTVPGKEDIKKLGDAAAHPIKTIKQIRTGAKAEKAQRNNLKQKVKNTRTQEDIVEVRNEVAQSEVLSAKAKAKQNAVLDNKAKKAPHEELLLETKESGVSTAEQVESYHNAIKRSTNRAALDDIVNNPNTHSQDAAIARERLNELNLLERNSAKAAIDNAAMKQMTGFKGLINKLRGKKSEAEQLKLRIKKEVHDPAMKDELIRKIDAKEALIKNINDVKHPTKKQYADFIERADDEVVLEMLEKKLLDDTGFFRSKTKKSERTELYKQLFEKQHEINPEKYPEINAGKKLKAKRRELEESKNKHEEAKTNADEAASNYNNVNSRYEDNIGSQDWYIARQKYLRQKRESLSQEIAELKAKAAEQRKIIEQNKISARTSNRAEQNQKAEAFLDRLSKTLAKEMAKDKRFKFKSEAERVKLAKQFLLDKKFDIFTNRDGANYSKIMKKNLKDLHKTLEAISSYKRTSTDAAAAEPMRKAQQELTHIEENIKVKEQELTELNNTAVNTHERMGEVNGEILQDKARIKEAHTNMNKANDALNVSRNNLEKNSADVQKLQKDVSKERPNVTLGTYAPGAQAAYVQNFGSESMNALTAEVDQSEAEVTETVTEEVAEEVVEETPPVSDEGTPASDEGTPASDEGTPASDEGTPVSDEGTPASDEGTPASDEGTPASDEGTPASDEGTPASDEGTPASDEGTPASDEETPASGGNAPAADENAAPAAKNPSARQKVDNQATPVSKETETDAPVKHGNQNAESPEPDESTAIQEKPAVSEERSEADRTSIDKSRKKYNVINDNAEITLPSYIEGLENGKKTDITTTQQRFITQQISHAKTEGDIALIYSELRTFKNFKGRKQMLKQLKEMRNNIKNAANTVQQGKMQNIEGAHSTSELDASKTATKKRSFFQKLFGAGDKDPFLLDEKYRVLDLDT